MSFHLDPHSLLGALYAFYQEHQRCGELDGDVESDCVWMTCSCGSVIRQLALPLVLN